MLTVTAIVLGVFALSRLSIDLLPQLIYPQIGVRILEPAVPTNIMEDQVTYPIVSTMVGAPKVKAVRGFSDFGYSYVYVIFEDGTDIYWARSRTQEYLSAVLPRLPEGAKTEIGPDATPLGWIFQYALVDESGKTAWPTCGPTRIFTSSTT